MSIIIVGSNSIKTSEYYKVIGVEPSKLAVEINHGYPVGHTCIQDVPEHNTLETILKNADEVYWAHPAPGEFFDYNSYYDFLNWLKDYNLKYRNVKNFNSITFDPYKWNNKVTVNIDHAVFIGCSFTAGAGLSDPSTHYANIVSSYFEKKLLNLSQSAGSNSLIFDKFFQLNLHPGQLVVLQLTLLDRLNYCDTNKRLFRLLLSSIPTDKNLHQAMLEVYHKDFLFYELLCKIRAIVKVARVQKLRLVFWLLDYKNETIYSKKDQEYFYNMPEFVPASWIENYLVDSAEDRHHPGIESNKILANTLIKYIETIYEC